MHIRIGGGIRVAPTLFQSTVDKTTSAHLRASRFALPGGLSMFNRMVGTDIRLAAKRAGAATKPPVVTTQQAACLRMRLLVSTTVRRNPELNFNKPSGEVLSGAADKTSQENEVSSSIC